MDFSKKKCIPCETGEGKLTIEKIKEYMIVVPDWLLSGESIIKEFTFKDFIAAMKFVNKVASLAEDEGHHPDFFISWNKVKLTLTTHAAKGLTENDFIMAAKIGSLV